MKIRGGFGLVAGALSIALLGGCGGTTGGTDDGGNAVPPAQPTGLSARPGPGSATVSWVASPNATGYRVHFSPTLPVTTANPAVEVAGSPAQVTGLLNGKAYHFAVSALGSGGASALADASCAVPTTADTTGLTLYDPLCGARIDGSRWINPATWFGVSAGAAVLGVDVANEQSRNVANTSYNAIAWLNGGGARTTTLRADVNVSAAGAQLSGGAQGRAVVHIAYQPPAYRLAYPGGSMALLLIEVGLVETGTGLQVLRQVLHCDDAACLGYSGTGLSFVDPPAFQAWGSTGTGAAAPASHDTAYTVTVSLDELTGTFHWNVAGGSFGPGGASGSVDPSAYLAATPAWAGVPLAGAGFLDSGIGVRTWDPSAAGGGAARMAARFSGVWAGFDGAAAAPFDDFGGTAGNSGPSELSLGKWSPAGASAFSMVDGALQEDVTLSPSSVTANVVGVGRNIGSVSRKSAVQADLTVATSVSPSGRPNRTGIQGRFYNDGTQGTTQPDVNGPFSLLGDVVARLQLNSTANTVEFALYRFTSAAGDSIAIGGGTVPGATAEVGVPHTLRIAFDEGARKFTFSADGRSIVVDPQVAGGPMTEAAPYAGPANAPFFGIQTAAQIGATSAGHAVVRVNNVFTSP